VIRLLTKGPFLFFEPEWRYTFGISKENIYFVPIREYWVSAYWLTYPALVGLDILLLWGSYPVWNHRIQPQQRLDDHAFAVSVCGFGGLADDPEHALPPIRSSISANGYAAGRTIDACR
jgi:hypothetical protein